MNKTISVCFALLLAALVTTVQSASATTCDVSDLTLSTSCQIGTTNNDFLNPLQVNTDVMFTFGDWLFSEKWDKDENKITDSDIDLDFNILGGADFGTGGFWSVVDDIWDNYSDVMIVMKGGKGSTEPNYIGYLIKQDVVNGEYTSPFTNPNNGNLMDISHWSLYVRGDGTTTNMPEPAPLAILGFGLLGLGLLRRRRG